VDLFIIIMSRHEQYVYFPDDKNYVIKASLTKDANICLAFNLCEREVVYWGNRPATYHSTEVKVVEIIPIFSHLTQEVSKYALDQIITNINCYMNFERARWQPWCNDEEKTWNTLVPWSPPDLTQYNYRGKFAIYYRNGITKQCGSYENGKPIGFWEDYDSDGCSYRESNYVDGKLHGHFKAVHCIIKINENRKISEGDYDCSKKMGKWLDRIDIPDGIGGPLMRAEGMYQNDMKVGTWRLLDKSDSDLIEVSYDNDQIVWYVFLTSSGIRKEGRYRGGVKVGKWIYQIPNEFPVIHNFDLEPAEPSEQNLLQTHDLMSTMPIQSIEKLQQIVTILSKNFINQKVDRITDEMQYAITEITTDFVGQIQKRMDKTLSYVYVCGNGGVLQAILTEKSKTNEKRSDIVDPQHARYYSTEVKVIKAMPLFRESMIGKCTPGTILKDVTYYMTEEQAQWSAWEDIWAPDLTEEKYTGGFTTWWPSGHIRCKGQYENGYQTGLWQCYSATDGHRWREDVNYANGKLHGQNIIWCDDKIKSEKNFKNGKQVGYEVSYDIDTGLKESETTYDDNGKRESGGIYNNGQKDGQWIDRIQLMITNSHYVMCIAHGNYNNGLKNGTWKLVNSLTNCIGDGEVSYSNDKLNERFRFRLTRDFYICGKYHDGKPSGKWIYKFQNEHQIVHNFYDNDDEQNLLSFLHQKLDHSIIEKFVL